MVNEILGHAYQVDVVHKHFYSILQVLHISIRVVDISKLPGHFAELLLMISVLPLFMDEFVSVKVLFSVEFKSVSRTQHSCCLCSELFFGAETGEEHESFLLGRVKV